MLVFSGKSAVTGNELLALDSLIHELGDDSVENFLKIHYVVNTQGTSLEDLTQDDIEDLFLDIFLGTSFIDLRKEAAYQLFEANYPEEYRIWEKSHCDGLIFDQDRFLDSPVFSVEEIQFGDRKALMVAAQ